MTDPSRQAILDACRAYQDNRKQPEFEPGRSYIPSSGKVVDADDLVNLVDASLDMWLTAGRFTESTGRTADRRRQRGPDRRCRVPDHHRADCAKPLCAGIRRCRPRHR
jgi:hypothetical protein